MKEALFFGFNFNFRPNLDQTLEKLSQTERGTNSRVRVLRELFYKSRNNEEFCNELVKTAVIEIVILETINTNDHETERNWAAGILENILECSKNGRDQCYKNGGVRILMKRIYKEKTNSETKRSCVAALGQVIKINKEAKESCVKFGGVKMFMDLLENYDSAIGVEIVNALGNLMQDLPDEVAAEVAERGGCDQFIKRIECNMYKCDRVYGLRAMASMLPKVEKARDECIEKEFQQKLMELIENEDEDNDEIKLHASHCLVTLCNHSGEVVTQCKENYVLIFLDPLMISPQYEGDDLDEKVGKVKELVKLLGGVEKQMAKLKLDPPPLGKKKQQQAPVDEEGEDEVIQ